MAVSTIQLIGASFDGAGAHNAVYRGKYLGSSVTSEQWAAIGDGTFKDLYIGDYWTIGGINWRIADFNYWVNMGNANCTTAHAVIVPDTNLYTAQMNTTDTTNGAYAGTTMRTTNLNQAKTQINGAFGSEHILSKKLLLQNAVSGNVGSTATWYDSTVDLMNEINVYGCRIYGDVANGTATPALYTVDSSQFSLFRHYHSRISNRSSWWLRDVCSSTSFCVVNNNGDANNRGASSSSGVRPAFGICG